MILEIVAALVSEWMIFKLVDFGIKQKQAKRCVSFFC